MEKASFDCPIISPANAASEWPTDGWIGNLTYVLTTPCGHLAPKTSNSGSNQLVPILSFQELTGMLYVIVFFCFVFFNRNVKKSSGNLRLIDSELEITVEASSTERFPVKIRPSKAKVIDLLAEIEQKLGIPAKDQKVYHGMARISDAPQRGLPPKLISSLQPTVVVIVPEYINITVQDMDSGENCIVKFDKAKTLKDLLVEIPLCRNLPENIKATFYFKGEELRPTQNDETLSSLEFCCGSKLDMKR